MNGMAWRTWANQMATGLALVDAGLQLVWINPALAEWVEFAAQAGFGVTGVTRRRLPIEFSAWLTRQRTPPVMAEAIRALFAAVPQDVRDHFEIGPSNDFTMDVMVMELRPL